ncbi:MAG: hypothetical protein AAGJ79_05465 [Verrucomicrobiota bacterium]
MPPRDFAIDGIHAFHSFGHMKVVLICLFWCSMASVSALAFGTEEDKTITEEELIVLIRDQLLQRAENLRQQLGETVEVELEGLDEAKRRGKAAILEAANQKLKERESIAFGAWESNPLVDGTIVSDGTETREKVTTTILGSKVTASNLGVILDNSGSMDPYLDALRAEITEFYPKAHFAEVSGCQLWGSGYHTFVYANSGTRGNPFDPDRFPVEISEELLENTENIRYDPLSAFIGMIEARKVDSIIWFCDFNDPIYEESLDLLCRKILAHEVQVYITSVEDDGPEKLKETVEKFEGYINIRNPSELPTDK